MDKIFRDALAQHEVFPPQNGWEKLAAQLPAENKFIFASWMNWSLAAAFIGVVISTSIVLCQKDNSIKQKIVASAHPIFHPKSKNIFVEKQNDVGGNLSTISTNNSSKISEKKSEILITKNENNRNRNVQLDVSQNQSNTLHSATEVHLIAHENKPQRLLAATNSMSMQLMTKMKLSLVADGEREYNRMLRRKVSNDMFIDELLRRQLYFVKGWHIGVKGEFNNTWILVNPPSTGTSMVQLNYKIDAGLAYGLLAGYDFNNKFGFQIEYHLVSQMAQRYEISSQYAAKNGSIRLNYNHIPLLFKFKWHPLKGVEQKPVVMDYMVGVQYGWLKSTTKPNLIYTAIPGSDYINQQVNLTEWDFVTAVNYDMYLNDRFFISMGGRATFGGNVKKLVNDNISAKSKNLTLGLEVGLHYKLHFGKQK